MKRLILVVILVLLVGCATKQDEVRFYSEPTPTEEFVGEALLFVGGAALDMWLWDNGHFDTSGQRAPDWWTDNR